MMNNKKSDNPVIKIPNPDPSGVVQRIFINKSAQRELMDKFLCAYECTCKTGCGCKHPLYPGKCMPVVKK
jgi:hypothetical protein